MARRSRLEMMEQRPHRCITPSTDPWRECCDDRRLPEDGSTVPGPVEEEVATVPVLLIVLPPAPPVVALVFSVASAVAAVVRRPSDAEVPRDLFVAATLTAPRRRRAIAIKLHSTHHTVPSIALLHFYPAVRRRSQQNKKHTANGSRDFDVLVPRAPTHAFCEITAYSAPGQPLQRPLEG
uniref:Uncharacterized protein n=1 Tax=Anopheles atroparvus TaxID=41427 RepID=A0A182ITZ2_ANOAO